MDRRQFLGRLTRLTLALGMSPLVAELLHAEVYGHAAKRGCEVWFYTKLPDKTVQCSVCPVNCVLHDGETCPCRTRTNYGGTLVNDAFNNPCIMNIDPVEKGPFYHFLPGIQTLALGTAGCNLRCVFCQNWQISQKTPQQTDNISLPYQEVGNKAAVKNCSAIMFTYNEPVVCSEYVYRVGELAKAQSLRVVTATSAFINPEPLKQWCRVVDGFVVSIKACTDEHYQRICGQKMAPVLKAMETIRGQGKWLELVYVIVPTVNDSPEGLKWLFRWVRSQLGEETPFHLSRFFPAYKLKNLPRTPLRQMEEARQLAQEAGLKYVYLDNVPAHPASNTSCPRCGKLLIERMGFTILKHELKNGTCPSCGKEIAGIWT